MAGPAWLVSGWSLLFLKSGFCLLAPSHPPGSPEASSALDTRARSEAQLGIGDGELRVAMVHRVTFRGVQGVSWGEGTSN